MNKKMILYMIGRISFIEGILMLLPLFWSIGKREDCYLSFLITICIAIGFGVLCSLVSKPKDKTIYAKEGFVIVALAWIVMSAIGALPFYLSREIPSYVDAFFETVSGFTTTGSSILPNLEELSQGILLWRSFTHWVGGMGVLVLVMAILPTESGRSMHIMRAEMPGPIVGKLVPKIKSTAKILYLIYIALTALEMIMLLFGRVSVFESLIYSFGTAGTGGFGIKTDSLTSYSPYIQWVIAIFMLIFSVNFNLYYLMLVKKIKSALKSEELWFFVVVVLIATGIITANIYPVYKNFSETLRTSVFQVAAIVSTTGFATADFNLWPTLSKSVIFILMFMGGCAGSTAGGLKVSRVMVLFKSIRANLRHLLHPRSVVSVRLEGKALDKETANSVGGYFAVYMLCLTVVFFILSFEKFDIETNLTAAVTCFNNVGPGLSKVGPMGGFGGYSAVSKVTLSGAMLLGRLEIFPMLLLFSPSIWLRKGKKVRR